MKRSYSSRDTEDNSVHQTELYSIGALPTPAVRRDEEGRRSKVHCNLLCTDFASSEFRVRTGGNRS